MKKKKLKYTNYKYCSVTEKLTNTCTWSKKIQTPPTQNPPPPKKKKDQHKMTESVTSFVHKNIILTKIK